MTDDKFRRPPDPAAKLAELREGKKSAEPLLEAEEVEDEAGEPYSLTSADRQQKVMSELRFKKGDATALAYSYLVRVDLNPSKEIVLDFSAYEVHITGRNLRRLFTALVTQRAAMVQEVDELYAEATHSPDAEVVTSIEVRPRT